MKPTERLKILLGEVDEELKVRVRTVYYDGDYYPTHANNGLQDGPWFFRVVGNKIFWWDMEIPTQDILDAVNHKLDRMGVPSPRRNASLETESFSYRKKMFRQCHGYIEGD